MRNILLVDVDSKIPNIALMKLSTYHKSKNDVVSFLSLGKEAFHKNYLSIIDAKQYDKVYVSIIFIKNKDMVFVDGCKDTYFGGSGYDLHSKLSAGIDNLPPDYKLYPLNNISYGFITRGCIRKCKFCVVPEKEGKLYFYQHPSEIIKHKRVVFLDNNFLAYKGHKDILQYLIDVKISCQFNQGLDMRLIDDENAQLLRRLNYSGNYTFAFDDIRLKDIIECKFNIWKKYIHDWGTRFFIYVHPSMDICTEVMARIAWCRDHKVNPYVMRDADCHISHNSRFYTNLAAYCNQVSFFKGMTPREFIFKRIKNKKDRGAFLYYFTGSGWGKRSKDGA